MNGRRHPLYTVQTETGKIDGSMVITKKKNKNDYRVHQIY